MQNKVNFEPQFKKIEQINFIKKREKEEKHYRNIFIIFAALTFYSLIAWIVFFVPAGFFLLLAKDWVLIASIVFFFPFILITIFLPLAIYYLVRWQNLINEKDFF